MTKNQVADAAEKYAAELGAEHGANAAEWFAHDAFGGRVTRGADESAKRILKAIEDCELEGLPRPDLSGEWADTMTGPELVSDAISDAGVDEDRHERLSAWLRECCFTDICDAYENAFNEACEATVVRLAQSAVSA